jgi:hypothetical protein
MRYEICGVLSRKTQGICLLLYFLKHGGLKTNKRGCDEDGGIQWSRSEGRRSISANQFWTPDSRICGGYGPHGQRSASGRGERFISNGAERNDRFNGGGIGEEREGGGGSGMGAR